MTEATRKRLDAPTGQLAGWIGNDMPAAQAALLNSRAHAVSRILCRCRERVRKLWQHQQLAQLADYDHESGI
jgi:hypothetical protein